MNNATGVTIGGKTIVNGNLTLSSGKVTLGSNNLLLGPTTVFVGAPSASVMIIVTGTGELRKEFMAGFAGTFTYPVGDDTGTPEYSPVTLISRVEPLLLAITLGLILKTRNTTTPGSRAITLTDTGTYLSLALLAWFVTPPSSTSQRT